MDYLTILLKAKQALNFEILVLEIAMIYNIHWHTSAV